MILNMCIWGGCNVIAGFLTWLRTVRHANVRHSLVLCVRSLVLYFLVIAIHNVNTTAVHNGDSGESLRSVLHG